MPFVFISTISRPGNSSSSLSQTLPDFVLWHHLPSALMFWPWNLRNSSAAFQGFGMLESDTSLKWASPFFSGVLSLPWKATSQIQTCHHPHSLSFFNINIFVYLWFTVLWKNLFLLWKGCYPFPLGYRKRCVETRTEFDAINYRCLCNEQCKNKNTDAPWWGDHK